MPGKSGNLCAAALCLIGTYGAVLAQAVPTPQAPRGAGVGVEATASRQFESAIKGREGEAGFAAWGFGADYRASFGGSNLWRFTITHMLYDYSFSGDLHLEPAPRAPAPEAFRQSGLGVMFMPTPAGGWSWFARGGVVASYEEDADPSDALTVLGLAVASYPLSPRVALGAGLIAGTRINDPPLIFPVPYIEARLTDTLTLRTERGVSLAWNPDGVRRNTYEAAATFDARRFRLADDGPAPEGVFEHDYVDLRLGWQGRIWGPIKGRAFAAAIPWQEFKWEDAGENKVDDLKTDIAFSAGASATVSF
jgi:hypothetical protein